MKISEIRILSDENISPKVVSFLKSHNIDVLDVKEQKWHGRSDKELLNIAYLQQRFILTHDSDFGTLAVNDGENYHGIIYLRLRKVNHQNVINVLSKLIDLNPLVDKGAVLVIEERRIRIRYRADKEDL